MSVPVSRIAVAALALMAVVLAPLPAVAGVLPAPSGVTRLAGDDRYGTSAAISRASFTAPVDAVYVASGSDYADAVAGGAAAARADAPLLLLTEYGIPQQIANELKRLRPAKIYVLGGPGAISADSQRLLGAYADSVVRISGRDRYHTAAAISKQGWATADTVFLSSGATYADALSGGAAAAHVGAPLLLSAPGALSAPTAFELDRLKPKRVYLLGGLSAISATAEAAIRGAAPSATITRLAGDDRYETSAAVANAVWPGKSRAVVLATGAGFADALSGAPAAHVNGAPILLTRSICTPTPITRVVSRLAPAARVALGGLSAVSAHGLNVDCAITNARSITDPRSIGVVVNKLRPLNPLGFVPPDLVRPSVSYANSPLLRSEAANALTAMFAAAKAEGAGTLRLQSAYRSYSSQAEGHAYYTRLYGQAGAELKSARPGHSEHQTGLAADISYGSSCIIEQCFGSTIQGRWLAQNAHRFGYILRYPQGLTHITGYEFEPWHYRFVGQELSRTMKSTGVQTLEQFFGLPAAPTYR